ncbi:MAG: prenyltransferase [Colwelliaceae bacterium]|nr:prenyltransferase [Colwelliaceae bacterium]
MKNFIACFPAIRPPFLLLAPICVLLGQSIASFQGYDFHLINFTLAIFAALFSAISVNTLNEYQDFQSGLDLITSPTAFSGGSGLLKNKPELSKYVLVMSLISSLVVVCIGIYFIIYIGIKVIPLGLLGLIIIFTYTKWLNKIPSLCLIAPGLGFGVLIVVGSYLIQAQSYSQTAWLISLIPFFMINNLLLINQFPDINADKKSGRNHLPIKYGTKIASYVFLVFTLLPINILLYLVIQNTLPFISLLCIIPIILNFIAFPKIFTFGENISQQPKVMTLNVLSSNLAPLVLAITLFIAK